MLTILRALWFALGLSAVLISLSIVLAGPGATAAAFERAYDVVTRSAAPTTQAWPATMDSELRFYAPLFAGFGLLGLSIAWDPSRRGLTPWLALVFFLGGVGRAISSAAVGPPHPFFTALMAVELGLPVILAGLWAATLTRP